MTRAALRQTAVHAVMAAPLMALLWMWGAMLLTNDPRSAGLTAEPVSFTIDYLGLWALRSLLAALAITPLRQITRWGWLAPWRRPVGLWCFAYAVLHLSVYFGLDQLGSVNLLWRDVSKHPFILLGMIAWILLLPLAVTSTRASIRRLGSQNWRRLHRLVYVAAPLASIHFILRVKGFQLTPWIYAGIFCLLLLARLPLLKRGWAATEKGSKPVHHPSRNSVVRH